MKVLSKLIFLIVTVVFSYIVLSSITENVIVSVEINKFKEEAVLVESISMKNKKFYNVSRETDEPGFTCNASTINPGMPLDIIVRLTSSFNFPVLHEIFSFTIGGHAALICDDYSDSNYDIRKGELIETAYNNEHDDVFISDNRYWEDVDFTGNYIVLRVDLTEDEKKVILNQAVSYIGDSYNLSFLFNTKKSHYCSDLMTKAFMAANINLNYDGFATTVYDLIVSNKTRIVMYKEYNPSTKISSYYGVNII